MRAVILRSTHIDPDPRAEKLATLLHQLGIETVVLGWDRACNLAQVESRETYRIERLAIQAGYGNGMKTLPALFRWQWGILRWLFKNRNTYDLIVAIDFDTVLPAMTARRWLKKKLVYDVADFYCESRLLPPRLTEFIRRREIVAANRADALILCDEVRVRQLSGQVPSHTAIIYNSPLAEYPAPPVVSSTRPNFIYIGVLGQGRYLREVCELFRRHPEWDLTIGGFGPLEAELTQLAAEMPNLTFLGTVKPYSRALECMAESSAMFAIYDPAVPNHRYSSPNKLFEAMMLGKPLIVAAGTNMDEMVQRHNLGQVVPFDREDQIEAAFAKLASQSPDPQEVDRIQTLYKLNYGPEAMKLRLKGLLNEAVGADI